MYEDILSELSIDNVWSHILKLTEIAPERLSGTIEERKIASYIQRCFESFGIDFNLYEFDGLVSFPLASEFRIIENEHRIIPSQPFAQIKSTPPEGIEGELVYVGPGGLQDYEGKNVRGKITLAELSYSPPRPEKVRIAEEKGAIGQVQINWGLPEHDCLPKGTVKAVWGNPTPENFSTMVKIPVIGIKRKDGEELIERLNKGKVVVRVQALAERRWGKILLPCGRIEGRTNPDQFIIAGGHYDAWGNGATCNASGNAEVIELARVFSKFRNRLRRSIVFAFWPGHETGIMEGSSWFVDSLWDELSEQGVLYLNFDSTGLKGATRFIAPTSPEVYRFHESLLKRLLHYNKVENRLLARTGDQSFFGIGIPSIYGRHYHPEEEIKKWHGATLGWWYHSEKDTLDKIDKSLLSESLRIHAAYLAELTTCPLLPFEFVSVADLFMKRLKELEQIAPKSLKLTSVLQQSEALREKTEKLDQEASRLSANYDPMEKNHEEKLNRINKTFLRLCRVLSPELRTISGKYSQDTYGLYALSKMIPSLFPIEEMSKWSEEREEYKLMWTKMIRERNRVMDSLKMANSILDEALSK